MKKEEPQKDLQECRRRKEDTLDFKIKRTAALIGACGVIGAAITWAGSTVFATKAEVNDMFGRINQTSEGTITRVTDSEKDILVIKTQLQSIKEGQVEQSVILREIRAAVSR